MSEITTLPQANAYFQELNQAKKNRTALNSNINTRTAKLISFLRKSGPIIVYRDDTATIIEAVKKVSVKFDKALLGSIVGMPASALNPIKIAELVESGKLSAAQVEECQYEEEDYKLKMRKAKKKEIAAFRNKK
ncbi:hypothetical protein ACH95_17155 [Bacillus glycinifermentans]|uniref:hypothetical protein n=1 Tax=Bacillus TaxID=1386 RepID=UPI0006537242|nr:MULTISPECIES: hypothetical protein [Bacillus]KMM56654.1 hypothetical protein ACH95_17155 [Bacillus glycinifermentans]MBU8788850.1 hypothetical protein [Bacillus glycinifermentans]MDR4955280.1 hypothetical protein [Bacillus sonorensis]MDR4958140.1 hypothetical protein [Bacillus sonorensis]MEC0340050.1 hypothetical protein [Bacillus sonorensis]